ncbi:MAG: hypothetical protein CME36_07995 [unclassified Hahellaceae]|nr:hypothetical protein [Hahellaceae bacterium]|tara:strand:- start:1852 stop:3822 length:1971 start_codon:yes stop_codon:yes gene_type:complete
MNEANTIHLPCRRALLLVTDYLQAWRHKDISYGSLRILTLLMLAFTLTHASLSHASAAVESERPLAQAGIIDLTDYPLGTSELLPLDGEWLFLFGEFADPNEPFPHDRAHTVVVPDSWNFYELDGEAVPVMGYTSYYLKLELPESLTGKLGLRIPNEGPGYALYINGSLAKQIGVPGTTEASSTPQYGTASISLPEDAQTVELLFHVSNFSYNWAGLWYSVELGFADTVHQQRNADIYWDFFVAGIFCVTALFHLSFWLMRRNDWLSLAYVAVTVLALARTVSTGETIMLFLFPDLPFSILMKLEYGSFYALTAASMLFTKFAFPAETDPRAARLVVGLGCAGFLFVVFTPIVWFAELVTFYQLLSLVAILYFVYIAIKAIHNNRDGAKLIVFGWSTFFIFILNDILYAKLIIQTGYWLDIGLCVMILSQSILINSRFVNTSKQNKMLLRTVEKRNLALNDLTHNLELKVQQRTQELQTAMEEIETLAMTDELTGLSNRRAFLQLTHYEQSRVQRYPSLFCIGLIDIDNFKSVNDTFGHDVGDEVLKTVARTIRKATRPQDKVARWGGEEFIILFPKTSRDDVIHVAERVRRLIAETPVAVGEVAIQPTITMGVAGSEEKETIQELIQLADARLYYGKHHGKNRVCITVDDEPQTT